MNVMEYAAAKDIIATADAYLKAHATFSRGYASLSKEDAAHPDYAACTNELRGAVEAYELNRDKPAKFTAYVSGVIITTWPGNVIGRVTYAGPWHRNNFGGKWRAITVYSNWGVFYHGREYDAHQIVSLKQKKGN